MKKTSRRFTASDVAKIQKRQGKKPIAVPKKKNKFGAETTTVDFIKFPSEVHAFRYQQLKLLQKAGKIHHFIREPMFDLGGGVTCRADFMIVWSRGLADGFDITYEDVTGFETQSKTRNYKQVMALYGIEVALVRPT